MYAIIVFSFARYGSGMRRFPENLRFGVATSAYQIEGGWNANGKGESIWDRFTHIPGNIVDNTNGDIACDSYHNIKRDVEMLLELGVSFYRFSLSWPRILPNGTPNKINPDGIRYYNELIDELLANDIEPIVTIYHWDLPQTLQNIGGWFNPTMADHLARFASVAFQYFGDRVKTWVTINEPVISCSMGYGDKKFPPGWNMRGYGEYVCVHNMLRGHGKVYRLYEKQFKSKQRGQISLALHLGWYEPNKDISKKLHEKALHLEVQSV
jgi:beta-glucosidase/6-phospho-beta-glucosidase/beta-galactosidase